MELGFEFRVKVLVVQLCLTVCELMDCGLPGFSVLGILQVRILEWVAIPFSRGSSCPKDQTWVFCVSCVAGKFFASTTEPPGKPRVLPFNSVLGPSVVGLSLHSY